MATMITADRYIIERIHDGRALVLQANGLVIPCKWHARHKRLESVALNVTATTRVPAMYHYNAFVQHACKSNGWLALTLDEAEKQIAHY